MDQHTALLSLLLGLGIAYAIFFLLGVLSQHDRTIPAELGLAGAEHWPLVTVAVSARDLGDGWMALIQTLQAIDYPRLELLVMNDGSTDGGFALACQQLQIPVSAGCSLWTDDGQSLMYIHNAPGCPNLFLVDMPPSGPVATLNTALRLARGAYFLALEADGIPGQEALNRLVMALETCSPFMGAAGVVRMRNGGDMGKGVVRRIRLAGSWLLPVQVLGSLRSIVWARVRNVLHDDAMGPGTFVLLRTQALRDMRGFSSCPWGHGTEVWLDFSSPSAGVDHQKLTVVSHAHFWIRAPETWAGVYRQSEHRQQQLAPRARLVKILGLALLAFLAMELPLDGPQMLMVLGGFWLFCMALNLIALLNETMRPGPPARTRELLCLVLYTAIEPLIFQPLNALALTVASFKWFWLDQPD